MDTESPLHHLGHLIWPLVALLALAAVAAVILLLRRRSSPPLHARPVLTKAELAFHARLLRVARRMGIPHVFSQVAMAAIMDADRGMEPGARRALRNRFDRKIIDFVLCDAETNVLLVVELDDRTHEADRDRTRDALVAQAGHSTVRVRGGVARDEDAIEMIIAEALRRRANP